MLSYVRVAQVGAPGRVVAFIESTAKLSPGEGLVGLCVSTTLTAVSKVRLEVLLQLAVGAVMVVLVLLPRLAALTAHALHRPCHPCCRCRGRTGQRELSDDGFTELPSRASMDLYRPLNGDRKAGFGSHA